MGRTLAAAGETARMTANNVISPELVLIDPELRASLMAEFRAEARYDLSTLDWTTLYTDSGRFAFCASSDNDEEVSDDQGRAPLLIAAGVYTAASLAGMLFFGAVTIAALALVTTTLAWIG
jgi:hypothetical protein